MATKTTISQSVGRCIQARRIELNMSVAQLSEAIGVTARRMNDYEDGSTRVAPDDLLRISTTLTAQPSIFFESIRERPGVSTNDDALADRKDFLNDGHELIRTFLRIKDGAARKKIIDFAASIAAQEASLAA